MNYTKGRLWWTVAVAFLASCSDPFDGVEFANGVIDGQVIASAPVAGCELTMRAVDEQGNPEAVPFAELTTDDEGRFRIETGLENSAWLIECYGGRTKELVSGARVDLDRDVRLSAVLAGFDIGADYEGFAVSPMTTIAEALGNARLARGDKETTYRAAHAKALSLVGAHFGDVDLEATDPVDPSADAVGTLTESSRYGLVLGAMSELAHSIAEASSVSANVVNTVVLTHAMADDLGSAEALFDGQGGAERAVTVGQCPVPDPCPTADCRTVCDVGPRMVRVELALALDAFIGSAVNATGLAVADVREMRTKIVGNTEPELFGDAPADTLGPQLTAEGIDAYVDPDGRWWTTQDSVVIRGVAVVEPGDSWSVSATINGGDELTPFLTEGDNIWYIVLPDGALAPHPSANELRITAVDGAGNQTVFDIDVRYDPAPPVARFESTPVKDESKDVVSFEGPGAEVTHDQLNSPPVLLGAESCSTVVHKHVSLMDPGDPNPVSFRVALTDEGVGIDPSTVAYRFRDRQRDEWLTDWIPATDGVDIGGGQAFQIALTRDRLPEVATREGTLELVVQGLEFLGRRATATACWVHRPMGPPLQVTEVEDGTKVSSPLPGGLTLREVDLQSNNVANLINGVQPDAGAGVILFQVVNPHAEEVFVDVDFSTDAQISSTRRAWMTGGAPEGASRPVNVNCTRNPGHQFCTGRPGSPRYADTNFAVPRLLRGARAWDISAQIEPVAPCADCRQAPNITRFRMPPRLSTDQPRVFRIMVVATNLRPFYPGNNPLATFEEVELDGANVTAVTSNLVERCARFVWSGPVDDPNRERFCTRAQNYRLFAALTEVSMEISNVETPVRSSAANSSDSYRVEGTITPQFIITEDWHSTEDELP